VHGVTWLGINQITGNAMNSHQLSWVFLIQGWFSETLNDALVCRYKMTKASVIMVDCDMYLSAKEALTFCGPRIQDAPSFSSTTGIQAD
jgi:hypothetical protein